jgi:hypothetical protein
VHKNYSFHKTALCPHIDNGALREGKSTEMAEETERDWRKGLHPKVRHDGRGRGFLIPKYDMPSSGVGA